MHVRLIAVGGKPPRWVRDACEDYIRRLGSQLPVSVIGIAPGTRSRGAATARAVALEGERVLAAVRAGDYLVTLDERGTELSTREFAGWLEQRMQEGEDLAFAIGGPDGLAAAVLARSRLRLALSRLTLPHALARVVLAEQLYRAVSLLARHPYHRE
ncbi:MAG TPA: 23S rRNA (pseudouridine(1915)-N(3))-methyltransferase RlmH [Steroidobacteraceae bacterium]|jgi:23S rRNA (pseudouridine1915-N3)-methyltransferase|nr:23S rRNA (pseudouridine(1915)-N(3))-methyltransferase RlmH [Steroidobacteraceae bacterium]